jgi:hypothetical protein
VCVTGGFLDIRHAAYIDVMRRCGKLNGVVTVGNFVVVQCEPALQILPAFVGQVGDGAVIGMIIDGPVSEYGVRALGFQNFLKCFVMRGPQWRGR